MQLSKAILSALLVATGSAAPVDVQETDIEPRQAGCKDISVIFARGTTEPGTKGIAVGPELEVALGAAARAQGKTSELDGVPYPADVPGFLVGGSPTGSKTMAKMVADKAAACPQTKIVISGYSQGGQLVHNAAKQMPADVAPRVAAAVIFGDPNKGDPVPQVAASKTKIICHVGDNICDGGVLILPAHLTYAADVGDAAKFIMQQAA